MFGDVNDGIVDNFLYGIDIYWKYKFMNRSFSKIRHIQEANQRLEKRLMSEQRVEYKGQQINPGDQIVFMDMDTAELNKYINKKPDSGSSQVMSRKDARKARKQHERDSEDKEQWYQYNRENPTAEEVINDKLKKLLEGKTFQLYSDPNYTNGNQSQMSNLVKITKVRMPLFPGSRIGNKQNYNLYVQDMGYKGSDPQKNMGEFRDYNSAFGDPEGKLTFTCSYSNRLFADYTKDVGNTEVYNKELLEILRNTACN